MIENKLLYFLTYSDFKEKLDGGNIHNGSIAFIEDRSIIWTHGKEFLCSSSIPYEALMQALDKMWEKIEEITGESLHGITMTVSPEYYTSEDGCTLSISASSLYTHGTFETISFYVNDELVGRFENVDEVAPFLVHVNDTCIVRCEAKVLNTTYTVVKKIARLSNLWLGAGTTYDDVMIDENLVDISDGIRTSKDVTFEDDDRLFIILDNSVVDKLIRLDMNGIEIPLESATPIPGTEYTYFMSLGSFQAGTYNIDING